MDFCKFKILESFFVLIWQWFNLHYHENGYLCVGNKINEFLHLLLLNCSKVLRESQVCRSTKLPYFLFFIVGTFTDLVLSHMSVLKYRVSINLWCSKVALEAIHNNNHLLDIGNIKRLILKRKIRIFRAGAALLNKNIKISTLHHFLIYFS